MSNALKNVVESSASTLSGLVDEARSRIEDLPPLANARKRRTRKKLSSVVALVIVGFVAAMIAKQRRQPATQMADSVG